MLWSWEKKAGLHGDEANGSRDVFQGLLADFWKEVGILFVRYVNTQEADPQILEGIATLLQVRPAGYWGGGQFHLSHVTDLDSFRLLSHLFQDGTLWSPYISPFTSR